MKDPRDEHQARHILNNQHDDMQDFLTRPDTRTPRYYQPRYEYGAAVTRYAKTGRNRPWLNVLVAIGFGAMLGILLAYRG